MRVSPHFFVPGNHDIYSRDSYDLWKKNAGRTYYSFDYKGCHFLVLNTHEMRGSGAKGAKGADGLGAAQIAWAKADLAKLKNPRHVFVFFHHPIIRASGPPLEEWLVIDQALANKPATIFAGHVHTLTSVQKREGRRYFILGTTGAKNGVRESSDFPPDGRFQNYALVTVEENVAHVGLVGVGHVFPEDISRAAALSLPFAPKTRTGIVDVRQEKPGALTVALENVLSKPITVRFSWLPGPGGFTTTLAPGQKTTRSFPLKGEAPPRYRCVVSMNHQTIVDHSETVALAQQTRTLRDWHVVGPFDLDYTDKVYPPEKEAFDAAKTYAGKLTRTRKGVPQTIRWQPFRADKQGWVRPVFDDKNGDAENNDYVVAYAHTKITAPADMTVLALLDTRESDDGARVLLNGTKVFEITDHFVAKPTQAMFRLTLKRGDNDLLVKTKDRMDDWGFSLRLLDLTGALTSVGDATTKGPQSAAVEEEHE